MSLSSQIFYHIVVQIIGVAAVLAQSDSFNLVCLLTLQYNNAKKKHTYVDM